MERTLEFEYSVANCTAVFTKNPPIFDSMMMQPRCSHPYIVVFAAALCLVIQLAASDKPPVYQATLLQ